MKASGPSTDFSLRRVMILYLNHLMLTDLLCDNSEFTSPVESLHKI